MNAAAGQGSAGPSAVPPGGTVPPSGAGRTIRLAVLAGVVGLLTLLGVSFLMQLPEAVAREQEKRVLSGLLHEQPALDEACLALEPTNKNEALGTIPRPAPPLLSQDVSGKQVSLTAYRGQVVLVSFWASWCPPCVEEMPSMEALQGAYPNLTIMAISADASWADIRRFFGQGTAMTVTWDPTAATPGEGGRAGKLAQSWGTSKLPETYLIDRDGNIRYYFVNVRDWNSPAARRCIEKLLATT